MKPDFLELLNTDSSRLTADIVTEAVENDPLGFDEIEDQFVEAKIKLQLTDSKKVSQIHSLAEVLKIDYDENGIKIHYKTSKQNSDKIKKIIHGS